MLFDGAMSAGPLSLGRYYKTLFGKFLRGVYHYWKAEVLGHVIFSIATYYVTRQNADADVSLIAAIKANLVWLGAYCVIQLFRTPWLLDRERTQEIDISYQSECRGLLLAFELNLWNDRHVPTTIRKDVSLTVVANGSTFTGIRQSLQDRDIRNSSSGPSKLEDITGKIWPQNPLGYNIHESGWLVFFVRGLLYNQTGTLSADVQLDLVDASGKVHQLGAICNFTRGNLQEVGARGVLKQFPISC